MGFVRAVSRRILHAVSHGSSNFMLRYYCAGFVPSIRVAEVSGTLCRLTRVVIDGSATPKYYYSRFFGESGVRRARARWWTGTESGRLCATTVFYRHLAGGPDAKPGAAPDRGGTQAFREA